MCLERNAKARPKFKNELKPGGWVGMSRARGWCALFLIVSFWTGEDDAQYSELRCQLVRCSWEFTTHSAQTPRKDGL